MKRIIFSGIILLVYYLTAVANPIETFEVVYINPSPPQIGLAFPHSWDLSNDSLLVGDLLVIIDSNTIGQGDIMNPFIIDSSNTSGFAINLEGGTISFISEYSGASWGNSGWGTGPISGHSIREKLWDEGPVDLYVLCLDFASPEQGSTNVVFNEINMQCTWYQQCGFIELYNKSDQEILLAGWRVICDTIYDLPPDSRIPPHGFYIIDESEYPAAFDLDPFQDNLYLLNNDSGIVDQVGWSSDHGANDSFLRFPDGYTQYQWGDYLSFWGYDDESSVNFENGFPTRGSYNRYDPEGNRIIGIHADTINNCVLIQWTNPFWLTVFDQAILRKSYETFPATPFDGELIYEGRDQEYLDRDIIPNQMIYYTVFARTSCGQYSEPDSQSQIAIMLSSVGIQDETLPEKSALLSCYPNPFNGATTITLSSNENAMLQIYNISGARVVELELKKGQAVWNAQRFSSGLYFARVNAGYKSSVIKLVYLK